VHARVSFFIDRKHVTYATKQKGMPPMATTTTTRRTQQTDIEAAKTKDEAAATKAQAKRTTEQAERTLKSALTDVGYAALGVTGTYIDIARTVRRSTAKLPAVLLDTPDVLSSVASSTASTVRDGYADLVSRGRTLTGKIADEPAVQEAAEAVEQTVDQAKTAAGQAKAAGEKTARKAAAQSKRATSAVKDAAKATAEEAATQADKPTDEVADAAEATTATAKRQGKQTTGQTKAAGRSVAKTAESTGDAASAAADKVDDESTASVTVGDTGSGPFESRSVDQLQNRAKELDIEGRSTMNKDELITAIRNHA
jgi:hypothetical protein